jgi:hypothetical protein
VAYVLLVIKVLSVKTAESRWAHDYISFGGTVFPIVFVLAPTGLGLIGAAAENMKKGWVCSILRLDCLP